MARFKTETVSDGAVPNEEEKKNDFIVLNCTGEDNAVKARELPSGLDESLL